MFLNERKEKDVGGDLGNTQSYPVMKAQLSFCQGTGVAGSWLTSLLDQQLTVANSALVDSALDQINGFLFN